MTPKQCPYIALYGPEARREEMQSMFGCLPTIIGNCEIEGYVLSFAHRRGGGIVPTMIPGDGAVDAIIYWVEYYQQRRLERRLGYPMGIQRGSYDSIVEHAHPCRTLAYSVPLIRPHGAPDAETVSAMEETYRENGWNLERLYKAVEASRDWKPTIWRVK